MPKYRVRMANGDVYVISANDASHAKEMVSAARRVGLKRSRKRQELAAPTSQQLEGVSKVAEVYETEPGANTSNLERTRKGSGGSWG